MDQQASLSSDMQDATVDFSFVRAALYRRLKLVIAVPLILALVAAALAYATPDYFVATAVIQVDPRQKSASDDSGGAKQRTIEDEIATLQSDEILAQVVERLSPADRDDASPNAFSFAFELLPHRSDAKGGAIPSLRARLSVTRVRNTQLVAIRCRSLDAARSTRIANALTDVYLKDQSDGRWQTALAGGAPTPTTLPDVNRATSADRVFETLVAHYGLSLQLPGARVITPAEPPHSAVASKRSELIALAAAIGLILSAGTALVLGLLGPGGRIEIVERTFACPHLTSLPCGAGTNIGSAGSARRVIGEPHGIYTSALRDACVELEQHRVAGACRIILIASAIAEDRAEDCASNIAHLLAAAGEAVLLVDADLRTKTLTRRLMTDSRRGLLDQLARQEPFEDAIVRDGVTGLCFLPAAGLAPVPQTVSSVVASSAFADGFNALKEQFSTVILTAPPILDAQDACTIANIADQIVFVTAWDRTPRRRAIKAAGMLGANQRKLTGAVLTEIDGQFDQSIMSFRALLREFQDISATRRAA